jgi:hypothetical protein
MKPAFLIVFIAFMVTGNGFAQKRKKGNSGPNENGMASGLSAKIAGNLSCKCIDSVYQSNKSVAPNDEAIIACIDKEVGTYEMSKQLMESLNSKKKNINIYVSKKGSEAYKKYYYNWKAG